MLLFSVNPILIAAAVIPAVVLLIYVYRQDRLEREPGGLLLSLVLYGILSTGLALAAERLGEWVLNLFFPVRNRLYYALQCVLVIGAAEEGAKYVLLKCRTWNHPAFNCQFDGVVYAVFTALGFALWENITYVAAYGLHSALLRAVTAIPGHACFGVFMGVWYGQARRFAIYGDERRAQACRQKALWLPMLLHGAYDYIALRGGSLVFIVFILLLFSLSVRKVRQLSGNDRFF